VTKSNYDIIIVGAGLAGLAAACAVRRQSQLRIAIVEGASIGSNNPSPLTFTGILDKYDLNGCIKGKLSSFSFHNYQGSLITYLFKGHPLSVLDYREACLKLFSSLCEAQGPTDYINDYATGFSEKRNGIVIQLRDRGQVSADIMIDCSGRSKFSVAGVKNQADTSYYSHVYGAIFSNVNAAGSEAGCFLWPCAEFGSGGGWFYPLENSRASFGYAAISTSRQADVRELEMKFRKAADTFEPYSTYLKESSLESIERGTIPITYIRRFVNNRIMIVGDAAGMATNWTCMGVEPALKYGSLAGELAATAALKKDYSVLTEFQRLWEKENKKIYDFVADNASVLWTPNHYLWEWVIKNDLAFLSPAQMLERMQSNSHLLKKHQIISRALIYKVKSLVDKNSSKPRTITREKSS
jgi:flavin-dependent dehydrogenase